MGKINLIFCFLAFYLFSSVEQGDKNFEISHDKFSSVKGQEKQNNGRVYFVKLSNNGLDQTQNLQNQINSIPDGTEEFPSIIMLPEGKYWTEGNLKYNPRGQNGILRLENRHNLIIRGDSTTFFTKAPATLYGGNVGKGDYSLRRHFWIIESSNIILSHINIEGSNLIDGNVIGTSPKFTPDFWKGGKDNGSIAGAPAYQPYWEQEHAFDIRGSENITIQDCYVNGVWGDGVYIGGTSRPSKNIVLRNLHLRFTGRQGIAIANSAEYILIDKVWIEKGRRASIDLEPHSPEGYVRHVEIKNSRLHARMTTLAALGNGDVSYINFHDNEYSYGALIRCGDSRENTTRTNWIIRNNRNIGAYGSPASSMSFTMTNNIIIEGNTEPLVKTQGLNTLTFDRCEGEIKVKDNNFGFGRYIHSLNSGEIHLSENIPEQIIEIIQEKK